MKRAVLLDDVKKFIRYDKATGSLHWITKKFSTNRAGKRVGSINKLGYRRFTFNRKMYYEHQVIWLFEKKKWQNNCIDHIDGNPLNNNISNLRDICQRHNMSNMKIHRDGHLVGTTYVKNKATRRKRWLAQIKLPGRIQRSIGYYNTQIEAHEAYIKFRNKLLKQKEKQK